MALFFSKINIARFNEQFVFELYLFPIHLPMANTQTEGYEM